MKRTLLALVAGISLLSFVAPAFAADDAKPADAAAKPEKKAKKSKKKKDDAAKPAPDTAK